jgi:hypothetical protein
MVLRDRVEQQPPKGRLWGRVLRGPSDTRAASFRAGRRRARLPRIPIPRNRVNRIYYTPPSYKHCALDLDATEVEEVPASGSGQ